MYRADVASLESLEYVSLSKGIGGVNGTVPGRNGTKKHESIEGTG
jgi:hypothetical protein